MIPSSDTAKFQEILENGEIRRYGLNLSHDTYEGIDEGHLQILPTRRDKGTGISEKGPHSFAVSCSLMRHRDTRLHSVFCFSDHVLDGRIRTSIRSSRCLDIIVAIRGLFKVRKRALPVNRARRVRWRYREALVTCAMTISDTRGMRNAVKTHCNVKKACCTTKERSVLLRIGDSCANRSRRSNTSLGKCIVARIKVFAILTVIRSQN